jgi:hypothetical protein
MGQEMLGIETGSDTAVFIVKEKASKHFGGTTKDTFPKFDENEQGDHSFINFDSERQMQDWAQHIVVSPLLSNSETTEMNGMSGGFDPDDLQSGS